MDKFTGVVQDVVAVLHIKYSGCQVGGQQIDCNNNVNDSYPLLLGHQNSMLGWNAWGDFKYVYAVDAYHVDGIMEEQPVLNSSVRKKSNIVAPTCNSSGSSSSSDDSTIPAQKWEEIGLKIAAKIGETVEQNSWPLGQ